MSFQNSFGPDGSININVVPSFGRIVQLPEQQKAVTVLVSPYRSLRSRRGGDGRELFTLVRPTSTPADMCRSAPTKWLKTLLTNRTSTNTLRDPDSAADWDFDFLILISPIYPFADAAMAVSILSIF
jgi:hypothetical protein